MSAIREERGVAPSSFGSSVDPFACCLGPRFICESSLVEREGLGEQKWKPSSLISLCGLYLKKAKYN